MNTNPVELGIIIVNYRRYQDTTACIKALANSDLPSATKYVVIDNTPSDRRKSSWLGALPGGIDIKLIKPETNLGFAKAVNLGLDYVQKSSPRFILLINPDAYVPVNFFQPLKSRLIKKTELGIVAPVIRHQQNNQTMYGYAGTVNSRTSLARHHNQPQPIKSKSLQTGQFVSFACALIRSELLACVPHLNSDYFMYLEDVDYCLTARSRGYVVAVDPTVVVQHQTSASFTRPTDKLRLSYRSQLRFIHEWSPPFVRPFQFIYVTLFYIHLYLLWSYQFKRKLSS